RSEKDVELDSIRRTLHFSIGLHLGSKRGIALHVIHFIAATHRPICSDLLGGTSSMKRANLISAVTMCAVVTLFTYGCADPDPGGAFDQYTEIVGEESLGTAGLCDADDRDLSGFYFVRLQHDIGPSDHILMSFDVSQSGGKYNLVVQPLKTDVTNERINKLDENGDPICRVDKDGNIIYES